MSPNKKLGRNAPCWCGSGRKHKICNPDDWSRAKSPHEIWRELLKSFDAKYCQAPDNRKPECSGKVVRAHTIPKSSSLRKLARDGHVYGLKGGLNELERNQGQFVPSLVGVNKASTFTGFCGHHDNGIFLALEDEEFSSTPKQCFLLGYRALAREHFMKQAQSITSNGLRASNDPITRAFVNLNAMGVEKGLADINRHKLIYDQVLESSDYSSIRHYVIKLSDTPPIMCSGGMFPEYNMQGNLLQNLLDEDVEIDFLNYTSFATHYGGAVVFTWDRSSDKTSVEIIRSLNMISPDLLPELLVKFFFSVSENIMLNPDWWENLSKHEQDHLVSRSNKASHPIGSIPACDLKSGTVNVGAWKVTDRTTNAPL